jgi:starch synthase
VRVLMITPEATPFAQTGGLGEVLSALPAELAQLGLGVDVFMPKYRGIDCDKYGLKETGLKIQVDLNARTVPAALWEFRDKSGVRYLFVKCDEYFERDYLYGTPEADYEDNAERFVFLCRSAIEMSLAASAHYDVFHSHDWQASLAPVYLRTLYAGEPVLETSASVMTIHNLGYQGIFWHLDMPLVGVGWEFFTPRHMEFHGKLNFLKSGIVFADEVNTVSPGYRDEILTPEFGFGLEGILQEKGPRLTGILNGVDYKTWNPETDPLITANFGPEDLSGKALCKADLQKIAHLPIRNDVPIIGMVSRLSDQKGIDILGGAMPSLMEHDVQLVLLGTGEARYHTIFQEFAEHYPDKVGVFLSYDYSLAHKIFGGADMLLVPSRYEPCGLNQLYALKYGTVPIVRATGGLTDTVEEFSRERDSGTGFKFKEPDPSVLQETVLKAVDIFAQRPGTWQRLMVRGMRRDFSWKRSALEYVSLYEKAIADRKTFLNGAQP